MEYRQLLAIGLSYLSQSGLIQNKKWGKKKNELNPNQNKSWSELELRLRGLILIRHEYWLWLNQTGGNTIKEIRKPGNTIKDKVTAH